MYHVSPLSVTCIASLFCAQTPQKTQIKTFKTSCSLPTLHLHMHLLCQSSFGFLHNPAEKNQNKTKTATQKRLKFHNQISESAYRAVELNLTMHVKMQDDIVTINNKKTVNKYHWPSEMFVMNEFS